MDWVRAVLTAMLAAAATLAGTALAVEPPAGSAPERAQVDENPCIGEFADELRCPDLVMRRPYGLYTDRLTKAGHTVLRAGNVIDSVGRGPVELHGTRASARFMNARQRIYTSVGDRMAVRTGARLEFKFAHQQRYWWKFHDAARFELWRSTSKGGARAGPHRPEGRLLPARPHHTSPTRRAPRAGRVYPACSNTPAPARDPRHLDGLGRHYPPPTPSSGST